MLLKRITDEGQQPETLNLKIMDNYLKLSINDRITLKAGIFKFQTNTTTGQTPWGQDRFCEGFFDWCNFCKSCTTNFDITKEGVLN